MSDRTSDYGAALIVERLNAKDELTYQRGDTLDVKASIVLVVVTFLAGQSAELLAKGNLTYPGKVTQIIAAVSLALAGILVWGQLWPREYEVEAAEKLPKWRKELEEFYRDDPDASAKVLTLLTKGIIDRTTERIYANAAINRTRSSLLFWSYVFTTLSLGINLLSLFGSGLIRHPS
ncbi:MAG: hypothetical protein WCA76_01365 [Candidatus Sulfotelmatobacter sp.]|jgi:hypothetical protein